MDKNSEIQYIKRQITGNYERIYVGNLGERLIELMLPSGWFKYQGRKKGEGDMKIVREDTGEVLTLEIKASKRGKRGDWQFCLNKLGHTTCRNSDFVVLLCIGTSGLIVPFVIPCTVVQGIASISIRTFPMDYRGKYSLYRQSLNGLSFEAQIS